MAYSCCFSKRGNLDFLDFLQKKFNNINSRQFSHSTNINMHYKNVIS